MPRIGDMKSKSDDDQYSEKEAQKRFVAALKSAVSTSPMPLKSMTPKRKKAKAKAKSKDKGR